MGEVNLLEFLKISKFIITITITITIIYDNGTPNNDIIYDNLTPYNAILELIARACECDYFTNCTSLTSARV